MLVGASFLKKLEDYLGALEDATNGLSLDPAHFKLRYRKINALIYLQDQRQAQKLELPHKKGAERCTNTSK